jgi:hypothetical protein
MTDSPPAIALSDSTVAFACRTSMGSDFASTGSAAAPRSNFSGGVNQSDQFFRAQLRQPSSDPRRVRTRRAMNSA